MWWMRRELWSRMNQVAALNIDIRIGLTWTHGVEINWNPNSQKCYLYCKFLTYRLFFSVVGPQPSRPHVVIAFSFDRRCTIWGPLTVWRSKLGGSFWNYLTPQISEGMAWSFCKRVSSCFSQVSELSMNGADSLSKKHGYMYYLFPVFFLRTWVFCWGEAGGCRKGIGERAEEVMGRVRASKPSDQLRWA